MMYKKAQLIDDYRLEHPIQLAATKEIWKAKHSKTSQSVAMTILTAKEQADLDHFNEQVRRYNKLRKIDACRPILASNMGKKIDSQAYHWICLPLAMPLTSIISANLSQAILIHVVKDFINIIISLDKHNLYLPSIKLEQVGLWETQVTLLGTDELLEGDRDKNRLNDYRAQIIELLEKCLTQLRMTRPQRKQLFKFMDEKKDDRKNCLKVLKQRMSEYLANKLENKEQASYQFVLLQAYYYYQLNDFEDAKQLLMKLQQQYPNEPQCRILQVQLLRSENKHDEAIKQLQDLVNKDPGQGAYQVLLGDLYKDLGENEKAYSAYQKSLPTAPNKMLVLDAMGLIKQRDVVAKKDRVTDAIAAQGAECKLSDEQEQHLVSVCSEAFDITDRSGSRLLLKSPTQSVAVVNSYATMSWDQYFTDLSFGSYRTIFDGERRAYRSRSWHYVLKNMAIINHIYKQQSQMINILDIGCASGYFRRFLEGNYSRLENKKLYYWGVDIREDVLRRAIYNVHDPESGASGDNIPTALTQWDLFQGLPFKNDSFDFIVNFEMIKYLLIPAGESLISECYRVLKPGGQLFISTTHADRKIGYVENLTPSEFGDALTEAGFKLIRAFGAQATLDQIQKQVSNEDSVFINKLLNYHPPEIVAAIVAPLYPQAATQIIYFCEKPNSHESK